MNYFIIKAENEECNILMDRLQKFISLRDVCNYIGIQVPDLARLREIDASGKFKKENNRDTDYHLAKLKYFMENPSIEPIDIDCLSKNGKEYPFPIILDGRHRYLAAILRRDKTIKATFSGLNSLKDYLTGISNHVHF